MAHPHSAPPSNRPATPKQLAALASRNTGLPLGLVGNGLPAETASLFLSLFDSNAYSSKRPCKKCHAFLLVVSPLHEAARQFWGDTLASGQDACICVPCLQKGGLPAAHPTKPTNRPRPVAPVVSTPVQSPPALAVFDPVERFHPPDFKPADFEPPRTTQPLGYYPAYNFPEDETFTWLWYLVKRYDGWLDVESICDLILGDTVKIFRGDERIRIRSAELEDLPHRGSDMARYSDAKDRASLERLIGHALKILCKTREIANHNGVYKAVIFTPSTRFPHLSDVFQSEPPKPKPAKPSDSDPDLRRLYGSAVARALTELPVHARTREAVRQKAHHLLDRIGRVWDEGRFEVAWNDAADSRRIA